MSAITLTVTSTDELAYVVGALECRLDELAEALEESEDHRVDEEVAVLKPIFERWESELMERI